MHSDPFYFLNGCLKILMVGGDFHFIQGIKKQLDPIKFYEICSVGNCKDAISFLNTSAQIHTCICDLDTDDSCKELMHILKDYRGNTRFVVCTDGKHGEKSYVSGLFGARLHLDKSRISEWLQDLPKMLLRHCLEAMICPHHELYDNLPAKRLMNVLFENHPRNVSDWARLAKTDPRNIRRIISEKYRFNTLALVKTPCMFEIALLYYLNVKEKDCQFQKMDDNLKYEKCKDFYLTFRALGCRVFSDFRQSPESTIAEEFLRLESDQSQDESLFL